MRRRRTVGSRPVWLLLGGLWAGGLACVSGGAPPAEPSGTPQHASADRRCQLGSNDACAKLAGDCEGGRAEACTKYGQSIQDRDYHQGEETARWFRRGCELGDVEGCDSYGFLQIHLRNATLSAWGFERADHAQL